MIGYTCVGTNDLGKAVAFYSELLGVLGAQVFFKSDRGVGVRTLMALAGHSNMATTQRYIDLRPAMLKAAVELV